MVARLQRHIYRGIRRIRLAAGCISIYLGMELTGTFMPTLTQDDAVPHDDTSHHRVGIAPSATAFCKRQGVTHIFYIGLHTTIPRNGMPHTFRGKREIQTRCLTQITDILSVHFLHHTFLCVTAFSHPDCTVGPGIAPVSTFYNARGLSPPVGNFTTPRRSAVILTLVFYAFRFESVNTIVILPVQSHTNRQEI